MMNPLERISKSKLLKKNWYWISSGQKNYEGKNIARYCTSIASKCFILLIPFKKKTQFREDLEKLEKTYFEYDSHTTIGNTNQWIDAQRKCLGPISEECQYYFATPLEINWFRKRTLTAAETIRGKVNPEKDMHVVSKFHSTDYCDNTWKGKTYIYNEDNRQSPP